MEINSLSLIRSSRITKLAIFVAIGLIIIATLFGPRIVSLVLTKPSPILYGPSRSVILYLSGYSSALLALACLFCLYQLIRRLEQDMVFTPENITTLRYIRYLLFVETLIALITASLTYLPFVVIPLASGFMGLIIKVIEEAFKRAYLMQTELDQVI